jgi:biopolymer transport protein ExbD
MSKSPESEKIDMTPMIDVVFQLLIFFVLALKPLDIVAHLDVIRPMGTNPNPPGIDQFQVSVVKDGFRINDRSVSVQSLAVILGRIAHFGKDQTVIVACDANAEHDGLVRVLDLCHAVGLNKIALVSR